MRKLFPLTLTLLAAMLTINSCKEKKKSDDIIIAKYVPTELKAPIRMATDTRHTNVEWLNRKYNVTTTRIAADSLPMLKDENGQEYVDNRVTVSVTRADGTNMFNRTFTKESFTSYLDDNYRRNSLLENIVFHGEKDDLLKFGAVVSLPGSDDEFIPLDMFIDRNGGLTIQQGRLFDDIDDNGDFTSQQE